MIEALSEASAAMNDRRAERDSRQAPCGYCKAVRVGCILAGVAVFVSVAVGFML